MSLAGFSAKVAHIVNTEGIGSLLDRSQRYIRYRIKRAMVDTEPAEREWAALRGRYRGQRAFVIGNGPSLNATELYLLENEATMCFNRFDLMLERLNWLPTFYTTVDDRVLLDTVEIVNELSAQSELAFLPDIHPYCVDFRPYIEKRPNLLWLFLDRPGFSDELPYCGINKTVANVGIQILAYLGFTEIYLLGVDMTYSIPKGAVIDNARDITATDDDDESHFDPRYFGAGSKFHVPMLDETFLKFREARDFYEKRGVKIFNSTVGGVLEEFDRIPLDDILRVEAGEKRRIFNEMVSRKLNSDVDVDRILEEAPEVWKPEDVEAGCDYFVTRQENSNRMIMKTVFDYVPFGPIDGRHLFVRRDRMVGTQ